MRNVTLFLLLLLLSACGGESTYSKNIENRSDREIKILLYYFGYPRGDTISLSSNETFTFALGESENVQEDAPDCAERIDSAYVEISGGGTLTKNISRNSNWETETEIKRHIPRELEHTCTFVIKNSDIEN